MEISISPETPKQQAFEKVEQYLGSLAVGIDSIDNKRPWGGFFVVKESDTDVFAQNFFPDHTIDELKQYGDHISPKILVVVPGEKLSWQYHYRRAELWRVVQGPVGVITSDDDNEGPMQKKNNNEIVQFDAQVRHRLAGLDDWGVVAEIWQHTNPTAPSDESDIVRLSDAYGRSS